MTITVNYDIAITPTNTALCVHEADLNVQDISNVSVSRESKQITVAIDNEHYAFRELNENVIEGILYQGSLILISQDNHDSDPNIYQIALDH